jgi:N-glycosylase/DNA lyase
MRLSSQLIADLTVAVANIPIQKSRREAVVGLSMCIGATRSAAGPYVKTMSIPEQDLVYLLSSSKEILNAAPALKWTSIQINQGVSRWHVDTGNIGNSLILAVGSETKFTASEAPLWKSMVLSCTHRTPMRALEHR